MISLSFLYHDFVGINDRTKVRYETIQSRNKSFYGECMKYDFCFIDNGVISEEDLWKNEIDLIGSGKVIAANNLITYLNNSLIPVNHPILGKI